MSNQIFEGVALNFNVILQEVIQDNVTDFGFDISSEVDANEKIRTGKVMSIGERIPILDNGKTAIEIGDLVLFDKHKASTLTIKGVQYRITLYNDLISKIF